MQSYKVVLICYFLLFLVQFTLQANDASQNNYKFVTLTNGTVVRFKKITPIMFRTPSSEEPECITDDAGDFPPWFDTQQLRNGAVVVPFLIGIYGFTLLARLCDKYFLPCVERICEVLNLSQDVAAATFMAMATSSPELFVNVIGTFITHSDIGIGTIVGSSMFNSLGIAALGSLFASAPIQIDWWPVTRDTVIYIFSITLLIIMTWDGLVYWYEALIMFIVYFLYFVVIFNNNRISKHVRRLVNSCTAKHETQEDAEKANGTVPSDIYVIEEGASGEIIDNQISCRDKKISTTVTKNYNSIEKNEEVSQEESVKWEVKKLFRCPTGTWIQKVWFFYLWPIKLVLYCAIPNPKRHPKLFPLTFIMCIVFIALNSYIISWMITSIGQTFEISDSLMGMTLLAAGGCLPEAVSIIIMSRRGSGSMGISNSLGANSMNILLSLGLPWFVRTAILRLTNEGEFIAIQSGSLEFTILGLIMVAISLYVVLFFNKFRLSRRIGGVLLVVYSLFITAAIVSEIFLKPVELCSEQM